MIPNYLAFFYFQLWTHTANYSIVLLLTHTAHVIPFPIPEKILQGPVPQDTGSKLNVHATFRRLPERLLDVLCMFSLRPNIYLVNEIIHVDLLAVLEL